MKIATKRIKIIVKFIVNINLDATRLVENNMSKVPQQKTQIKNKNQRKDIRIK